ncbi:proton-conducting transporter transmembrane domain-containing protein [Sorangium sp. So ce341]|uniref:proton-conducting transporter transmembrane domain-containing protein n=1 Tax=Sorangium sp. So ce341 TaxID=3133302 RepID=UPI003F6456A8
MHRRSALRRLGARRRDERAARGRLPRARGAAARRGAALPFDVEEIARAGVPEAWQSPLFALVGIAVLMRMAAVPFHGWLPVLLERGPLGATVLLAEMQVGVCVLLRVGAALLPAGCAEGMPILAVLGLVSALHGAVLALVQTDLRRMLGYLVASQKGLVLLGLASLSRESVRGALLQSVASSIALTGLAMVIGALEARAGTADTRALGGLVARTPRMAAFFFLLARAAIGMPGRSRATRSSTASPAPRRRALRRRRAAARPPILPWAPRPRGRASRRASPGARRAPAPGAAQSR